MSESNITHVSDTALMVAACRALETARPDGLMRDPFAERLAGARGMAILRALQRPERLCFGVGIRSHFLDELVLYVLRDHGVRTVFSLGAGLDTRPWRLDLPAGVRWIEADFPHMIAYKSEAMSGETLRCALEQIPADLSEATSRDTIFGRAPEGRALVITEGLLMYLGADTVHALAARPEAAFWLMDVASPDLARRMGNYQSVENVRAANHLDGVQILETMRQHDWSTLRHRNYQRDAWNVSPERIQELRKILEAQGTFTPPAPDDPSGIHLFERSSPTVIPPGSL